MRTRVAAFPLALLALGLSGALDHRAEAQPFGAWIVLTGHPTNGYVRVDSDPALNPTAAFTLEAWVAISNSPAGEDCRSIAGKNYLQSWWIGQCTIGGQPVLRSFLKGGGSSKIGGIIPRGVWTHVAVVFNGTQRLHYINGELAASFAETGPLPASGSPLEIGSDVSWPHTPTGAIDEVRLWSVARTTAQIRAAINTRINTDQPGLVAVWALDGNANDVVDDFDGTVQGAGVGFLTGPVAFSCGGGSATELCLQDRFSIRSYWRTNPTPGTPTDGSGRVVYEGPQNSGLFWFFASTNWEVMVKAINGCGLNDRYWIFSAATTNVFYRLEVTDIRSGTSKIYFNYPGPPAPAVTDTSAFATCP